VVHGSLCFLRSLLQPSTSRRWKFNLESLSSNLQAHLADFVSCNWSTGDLSSKFVQRGKSYARKLFKPGHAWGLKKWGLMASVGMRKQLCKNRNKLTKTQIRILKSSDSLYSSKYIYYTIYYIYILYIYICVFIYIYVYISLVTWSQI